MNYNNIILWLEEKIKSEGKKSYRDISQSLEFTRDYKEAKKRKLEFFIDPMLPIDLISIESKIKTDDKSSKKKTFYYYELFWILSKEYNAEELKKHLPFYQFYLSRITKTEGVKIIIVSDSKVNVNDLVSFAEEYGFGIWLLHEKKGERRIEKKVEPKDYRCLMRDTFTMPPDTEMISFKPEILKKADELILFFEYFVREAIEAMASPISLSIKKRQISRSIIDLVFELENVSYANKLQELVSHHLISKNDDYDFVFHTFTKLWEEIGVKAKYSDFLKICEPVLLNIFSDIPYKRYYRDHYLHQFQVFLIGLYIIDKNATLFQVKPDGTSLIEKQWLITASFHDMAYPVQLYDVWAKKFFNDALGIPDLGESDISKHFVDKSLLTSTADIVNLFCKQNLRVEELKGNWLRERKDLIKFFHEKITKAKHHCVISSIYLLKEAEKLNDSKMLQEIFVPAALSIAMHHEITWVELKEKFELSNINFDDDKLTFLLLLCDAVQEWGRPQSDLDVLYQDNISDGFSLEKFSCEKNKCLIVLKSDSFESNNKLFESKETELKKIKNFLNGPKGYTFQITLKDKNNDKKEFTIQSN